MSALMRGIAPGKSDLLLRSAAATVPGEAAFAFGRGLDGSSGACERQRPAHAGPTGAA
jgi:hypothetical protein